MSLRHKMLGEYFGYPNCCIESFCDESKEITTFQKAVASLKYGFIPCEDCARKVVEGRIELKSLIKNRICLTEFPHAE